MSNTIQSSDNISIPRNAIKRSLQAAGGLIVGIVAVLLVIGLVRHFTPSDSLAAAVDSGQFQYITLTNGESYFGKLSVPGGDFCYLRQVYALTSGSTQPGKPPLHTLVKLMDEVHNPQDLLVVRRDQIVYVENLNPNGKGARLLQGKSNP